MVNKPFDSKVVFCLNDSLHFTGAPNLGFASWEHHMFGQYVSQVNKIGDRSTSIGKRLILYITMDGILVPSNDLLSSKSSELTVFRPVGGGMHGGT